MELLGQRQEPGASVQKRKEEDSAQLEHHAHLQATELGSDVNFENRSNKLKGAMAEQAPPN